MAEGDALMEIIMVFMGVFIVAPFAWAHVVLIVSEMREERK